MVNLKKKKNENDAANLQKNAKIKIKFQKMKGTFLDSICWLKSLKLPLLCTCILYLDILQKLVTVSTFSQQHFLSFLFQVSTYKITLPSSTLSASDRTGKNYLFILYYVGMYMSNSSL